MINKYKYHLVLHFTILIWGFTGIIGKTLTISGLSSNDIVFWRMLIAWVALLIYLFSKKENLKISRTTLLKFFGNGGLIALHWYFFLKPLLYQMYQ